MALPEFLQRRRKEVHPNWSQGDLARKAGYSSPTISRLESGKTKDPPLELLARVAPYYRVPVLEMWERGGYLRSQDAQAIAEFMAQVAPVELVRLGLEHGPWPADVRGVVWMMLNASVQAGDEEPTRDGPG